ncbi:MAG: hypothetical protein V1720_06805 [bacterium]
MKKINLMNLFLVVIFLTTISNFAQSNTDAWITLLDKNNKTLSINTYGLSNAMGDDFYLWVKEILTSPITIEGIEKQVYESRTYYLINKSLQRYSIVEIIYYDDNGNVLADYKYPNNSSIPEYRYNYPIFPESEMEVIFNKCKEFFSKG